MLLAASAVGGDEEAEVALDDQPLVVGQAVRVLPQLDVALHVDLLRHPVVGAAGEVLVPRPPVLERHELVDVGRAVDDALVLEPHAAGRRHRLLALDVEVVHRLAREDAAADVADAARGSSPACAQVRGHGGRRDVVVEREHRVLRLRDTRFLMSSAMLLSTRSAIHFASPTLSRKHGGCGPRNATGRETGVAARQFIAFSFSYRNSGAKSWPSSQAIEASP